jgi:type VI secretion system protein ImpG
MSTLLQHYEAQLRILREETEAFAAKHSTIARRLDLHKNECRDPHLERFIEASAFLAANVATKIEDQYSEIAQALLGLLYPHYLRPVPSMGIAQFDTDPETARYTAGYRVGPGGQIEACTAKGTCSFRTVYPVTLWPLRIVSSTFHRATPEIPELPENATAVVRIELATRGGARLDSFDKFDRLRFHVAGESCITRPLYELLMTRRTKTLVRRADGQTADAAFHTVGFGDAADETGETATDAALPYGPQSFAGFRLLQEYLALPEKFLFFDVSELGFVRGGTASDRFEILIVLDGLEQKDRASMLQSMVDGGIFRLACTPIVNLVDMPSEPIALTHKQSEYRIVPHQGRDEAFEIYSINRVSSLAEWGKGLREYFPFYSSRHDAEARQLWFATRRPVRRKEDSGTDMYLSFVDLDFQPTALADEYVTVRLTCTNRDLAANVPAQPNYWGLTSAKGMRARLLAPLTPARRPPLGGESQWRLISHMVLNTYALVSGGQRAFSELLRLYDFSAEAGDVERQIEGILSVASSSAALPVPVGAGVAFCRGTATTLTFDETRFPGESAFLLAAVLDRFLGLMAPLNSFSQVTAMAFHRERAIQKWAARSGMEVLC